MDISNNLKDFFENKKIDKITASSVADKLGISKTTLSNYINGDAYMPLVHLNQLCNLFHVSIDYLLGLSKLENYLDNIELEELNPQEIGKRLRNIRKNLKINQDMIASLVGVNKSSISRYEKGESLILTVVLYTFCKKYNISADYLLGKNKNIYLKTP